MAARDDWEPELSEEELQEVIREVLSGKRKLVWASSEGVDALQDYVDRILDAIGVGQGSWVSDRSMIGDLAPDRWDPVGCRVVETPDNAWLETLAVQLGFSVKANDLVLDVTRRMARKAAR